MAANLHPECWVPERILRGQLAAAGVQARLARCGDALVLSGAQLAGEALVCRVDRCGPQDCPLDEPLAQAACGLMAVHGRGRGRRAARLGVDCVTTATGVVLAQAVLAALLARGRGAAVREISVSMPATALLMVAQHLAAASAGHPDALLRSRPGHPPPFRCADGVSVELDTRYAESWRLLWTSLGVPDTVAERAWRPFMLRHLTGLAPLPARLHEATAARTFAELGSAAAVAGVAVQRLRSHPERRDELGSVRPFSSPWTVEPAGAPVAAPRCARAPARLDAPLAGVVVAEAGRRVQVPLAGHLLRLLGAEVISIEPAGGDPLRRLPPVVGDCSARFLALNRGKRALPVDLWDPAARCAVLDVVREADVLIHSWPAGKAAHLGLDHDHLTAINPRLVWVHAGAWGDALDPHPPLGTEFLVQAYAALPDHLTPAGQAPSGTLVPLLETISGLLTTSGVLAGLLGRERDGRGRRVHTSLLGAATLLQAHLGERGANGRPELDVLGVPLPGLDGELVLSRTAPPRAACGALGVGEPAGLPAALAAQRVETSRALLAAAGVDAVRACCDLSELATDPWVAQLVAWDRCALVRAPWRLTP